MAWQNLFSIFAFQIAQVVELVDTLDSKSNVARRAGSIPAWGTLFNIFLFMAITVYAISSLHRNYIYVGMTSNLEQRLSFHNKGYNKTTKPYLPFKLIHTQEFESRKDARIREKYLKSGSGKELLKSLIQT